MRQAIVTKFIGPTNTRGARVKATCDAKSMTFPWRHELGSAQNHAQAAMRLASSLEWRGTFYGGGLPKSVGYVFVKATNHYERPDGELVIDYNADFFTVA